MCYLCTFTGIDRILEFQTVISHRYIIGILQQVDIMIARTEKDSRFQKSPICIDLSNDLWREWGGHASRSPAGAGAPVCLPTRKRSSRSRKPAGRRKEHDEQARRPGEKLSAIKLSVRRKRSRQSAQFPWTVANSLPTRTTGSTDVVDGRTTTLRVQRKRRWTLKRPNTLRRSN